MGKVGAVFFLIWMGWVSFPWAGVLGQPAPGPEIEDRVTELLAEMSSFLAEIPKFGLDSRSRTNCMMKGKYCI